MTRDNGPVDGQDWAVAAWVRLVRAQRAAMTGISADLKAADMPPLEWYDVLLELRRAGDAGLRPRELEPRLLLAQHNVSRLLDRLTAQGLVVRRRCDADGRGQLLTLTSSGRELLDRMWPVYSAAIQRHVGNRLEDTEGARLLTNLLERLTQ